jgi:hypothetical protein
MRDRRSQPREVNLGMMPSRVPRTLGAEPVNPKVFIGRNVEGFVDEQSLPHYVHICTQLVRATPRSKFSPIDCTQCLEDKPQSD